MAAVNVILKNNSSMDIDAELIDQYGGNFTTTITAGMSQNQALMDGSNIVVNGNTVHQVSSADENMEVVIAA